MRPAEDLTEERPAAGLFCELLAVLAGNAYRTSVLGSGKPSLV